MGFFQRQDDSRRNTIFLSVLTIIGSITVAVAGSALAVVLIAAHGVRDPADWLELGVIVTAIALAAICLTILVKRFQFGRRADSMPRRLGATPLPEQHFDPQYRQLSNVVTEMALAAQIPAPAIFVLESELRIDAFAAGLAPEDASITVSRGCLDQLQRAELQAVVAHEFSHIVNDDIAVNLRLACLTAGLSVFWVMGKTLIRWAVRLTPGQGKLPAFLLVSILSSPLLWMGSFGVFFCRLMKAGISRQREYLADASAVQYTRNAVGLIGALTKAKEQQRNSRGRNRLSTELVSHMLFIGKRRGWFAPLATHPRIEKRIDLLRRRFQDA